MYLFPCTPVLEANRVWTQSGYGNWPMGTRTSSTAVLLAGVQSMTSGRSWCPKRLNNSDPQYTYMLNDHCPNHRASRFLARWDTGENYVVLLFSSMCIQRIVLLVFSVGLRSWLPGRLSLICLCGRWFHVRFLNNTSRKQLKSGAEKFKQIIIRCRSEFADHSSGFCVILVPITSLLQGKVVEKKVFVKSIWIYSERTAFKVDPIQ